MGIICPQILFSTRTQYEVIKRTISRKKSPRGELRTLQTLHLREARGNQQARPRRINQGRNTQWRSTGRKRWREGKNKGRREKMHDYDDIGRKTDDRINA